MKQSDGADQKGRDQAARLFEVGSGDDQGENWLSEGAGLRWEDERSVLWGLHCFASMKT